MYDSSQRKSVLSIEDRAKSNLKKVDPASCKMWDCHNRNYDALTEESCKDLIESFTSQGQQEFPAVVRKTTDPDYDYEVICGARRHWAAVWMRENGHSSFKYLIEVRELKDIQSFQLADLENRNRDDISHFERATDYLKALNTFYNGNQKKMALDLRVEGPWLSRYLDLARLPAEIISCFPQKSSIVPGHVKRIKQQIRRLGGEEELLKMAKAICTSGEKLSAEEVMKKLVSSVPRPAKKDYVNKNGEKIFSTEVVKGVLKLAIDLNKTKASNADLKKAFSKVIEGINGEVIVR